MRGRKIIVDVLRSGPDAPQACPSCGATLSSVDPGTLRPIARSIFRCPPGRHPPAFEARCGACGRLLIVLKGNDGLRLPSGDQDVLLAWLRDADRIDLGFGKGGDRRR